jgi:hypothetical protein
MLSKCCIPYGCVKNQCKITKTALWKEISYLLNHVDITDNRLLQQFIVTTCYTGTRTGLLWILKSVLFNDAVNCYDYIVLVTDKHMGMGHLCNDTDRGKHKSLCHFVHHKSHADGAWVWIQALSVRGQWQPTVILNNLILQTFLKLKCHITEKKVLLIQSYINYVLTYYSCWFF